MALRRAAALAIVTLGLALCSARAEAQPVISATLTLNRVFGATPTSATLSFGNIDGLCLSLPVTGVTCSADSGGVSATWYGDVQFVATLRAPTSQPFTAKLTAIRGVGGSIPSGQLLDGSAGTVPTSAYPSAGGTPLVLKTNMSASSTGTSTTVTRSLGVQVRATDGAGVWAGSTITYSMVLE